MELRTEARLPDELLWEIIYVLWHSAMSPRERTEFMGSSLLVNRLWMNIFTRVVFRDAYITSQSYLTHYLRILRHESPVYRHFDDLPNTLCRSITVEIKPPDLTADVLSDVLYMIKAMGVLPNLHTLILRYSDFSYWDIMSNYQFIDLPNRIKRLELHFPRPWPDSPQAIAQRDDEPLEPPDWYLPHPSWWLPQLQRLSIFGATGRDHILSCYVLACPNLHILETEFSIQDLKVHPFKRQPKALSFSSSTSDGSSGH